MSRRARTVLYTGRAATGILVSACAAVGIVLAATISPRYPQITESGIAVDIAGTAATRVACSGGFAELGTDPTNPGGSTAHGGQLVTSTAVDPQLLKRENGTPESYAAAFSVAGNKELAAAQTQTLTTEQLRGITAHACTAPLTDQWLVGGKTELGSSATVTVSNPGEKDAAVSIRAYNSTGDITGTKAVGALVPAGSSKTISVNGIVPGSSELALRVRSSGSPVSAVLGISETHDIRPQGVDTITAQDNGNEVLNLLGVRNNYDRSNNDAAGSENITAQILAPAKDGHATVYAVKENGETIELSSVELLKEKITNVQINEWPAEARAMRIVADTQIVGAAVGSNLQNGQADMVWFVPSPQLSGRNHAAIIPSGSLVLAAVEDTVEVEVTPLEGAGNSLKVKLLPGEVKNVAAPSNTVRLSSENAFTAAVTTFSPAGAAAYPVSAPPKTISQVSVYTN